MTVNKRKFTDKSSCLEFNGIFENLRIKINSHSHFRNCAFYNCTFVGRVKHRAAFEGCINR
jgi:hypothetical protein